MEVVRVRMDSSAADGQCWSTVHSMEFGRWPLSGFDSSPSSWLSELLRAETGHAVTLNVDENIIQPYQMMNET